VIDDSVSVFKTEVTIILDARQTGLTVGDITIHRIVEWETPVFRPVDFFPAARQIEIERLRPWLEPDAVDPKTGKMILLRYHEF
jgi:hypothetical protein